MASSSKLIIVRGVSGSGKSTIATALSKGGKIPIFEADMFFVGSDGAYRFDPLKLHAAHNWCYNKAKTTLERGESVIVSNTNMSLKDVNRYLGLEYDTIKIWRTPGPWDPHVLFERNVHEVPLATIQNQIDRYVPLEIEEEWNDLSIFNK